MRGIKDRAVRRQSWGEEGGHKKRGRDVTSWGRPNN